MENHSVSLTSNSNSQTLTRPDHDSPVDQRPRFAIGHISLGVSDVDRSAEFYTNIGMRLIVNMGRAAIVELRGGTHIILHQQGNAGSGSLDLIVDDIDGTQTLLAAHGADPSRIERGHPHDRFTASDPDGNVLVVHSNHAMGPV